MMFPEYFIETLQKVKNQVSEKINSDKNTSYGNWFNRSFESWCEELNLPEDVVYYIRQQLQQSEVQELTNDAWDEWKRKDVNTDWLGRKESKPSELKRYITEKILNKMKIDFGMDVTFVLLISFMVTAIGYVFVLLKHKTEKENIGFRDSQVISEQPTHFQQESVGVILVLAIKAEKGSIIQSLEKNKRVMMNEGEELYRATQALWMGTKKEFLNSQLQNWFSDEHEVQESEKSEYDVYFVEIELKERDPGFNPNTNSLDRLDAFRRLPSNSKNVRISPRLPSRVYENTGVYSR